MAVCSSRNIARSESNAQREAGRRGLSFYKCEECGWWHIQRPQPQPATEQTFRKRKKKRR